MLFVADRGSAVRLRTNAKRTAGRMARWLTQRPATQRVVARLEGQIVAPLATSAFDRRTDNARAVRWLGHPTRQNPLDAWALQETIVDQEIDLVVECGTLHGGSAYFLATIFDLVGRGNVVTVDVEPRVTVRHPRVDYVTGSSTDPTVVAEVRKLIEQRGARRVLVLLDSDHAADHVHAELRAYADLTPVGGYLVVQDGIVDILPGFRHHRPGPLVAIERFLAEDDRFVIDDERSHRYLLTYCPNGYLRRVR